MRSTQNNLLFLWGQPKHNSLFLWGQLKTILNADDIGVRRSVYQSFWGPFLNSDGPKILKTLVFLSWLLSSLLAFSIIEVSLIQCHWIHTSIREEKGTSIFRTKLHRAKIQRIKIPVWGKGSPKRSLPKHTLCELGLYKASEICWRDMNRSNCSVKGKFAVCTEATHDCSALSNRPA